MQVHARGPYLEAANAHGFKEGRKRRAGEEESWFARRDLQPKSGLQEDTPWRPGPNSRPELLWTDGPESS